MRDDGLSSAKRDEGRRPTRGVAGRRVLALLAALAAPLALTAPLARAGEAGKPAAAPAATGAVMLRPLSEPEPAPAPETTASLMRPGSFPGTGADASSLSGAMAHGYFDNPSVVAKRAGQKAIDEGVAQALSTMRPTLTASVSTGYTHERYITPDSKDLLHPQSAGVSASLLLFDGFASLNAVRSAEARAKAGQEALSDSEQRLLAEIAKAYAEVWRDRNIVSLQHQNVGFLSDQLRSTRRRLELGDVSRTDVAQAEARYNESRAELSAAKADLIASESRFTELVGVAPGKLARPVVPDALLPKNLDGALAEAARHNPLVRKAEHDEVAADREVDARVGAFFPKVTVDTNYESRLQTSTSYNEVDEFSVYLRLNFPFYDGGAKESRYREAKARAIEKSYERDATKRGVWSSVRTLWHRRLAATSRIDAARRQLAAADLAVEGLTIEAKVGQRSVIDILDGQRDRVSARIAVARASADYVVASYQLLAAIGRCTPGNLGLAVEPYDPTTRLASIKRSWLGLFVQ